MKSGTLLSIVLLVATTTGCSLPGGTPWTSSPPTWNGDSSDQSAGNPYAMAANPIAGGGAAFYQNPNYSTAAPYPANAYQAGSYPTTGYPAAAASYAGPTTHNPQPHAALPSQTTTPYQIGQPQPGRYSAEQLAAWSSAARSGNIGRAAPRGRASTPC